QLSPEAKRRNALEMLKIKARTAREVTEATEGAKLKVLKQEKEYLLPRQIAEEKRANKAKIALEEKLRIKALRQKKDLAGVEIQTAKDISLETLSLGERQHKADILHKEKLQVGELAHKKDVVKIEAAAREKMAAKTMQESTFATMKSNFLTRAHKVKAEGWIAKGAKIPISVDMLEAIQNAKNKNLMVDLRGLPLFTYYGPEEEIPDDVKKQPGFNRRYYNGFYLLDEKYTFATLQTELLDRVTNSKAQGELVFNEVQKL
ncbi:uncharacterized protein METZ01_LOCUS442297, partial [marine metagenome]